ncbi:MULTISPECIES: hypothetical protein [Haloarcula]|uniref:Uncharacterized protein n=1 Tax=Haloarcula pellucida TaxID=1427151 RepID=A0A830GPY0_9EURY|nr:MULTISPECIES: hypothetical protein [Halomicroarcula]MDS0279414.1 hypothetical protein [Halomicroarcula sp. S1AR25-4]QIO21747.1 hypothetical protein G9465_05020 [Haloarcula sp. JP-L23]GGN98578.1 hypothetical protein GCM10009030_29100 [Halomicroarcula pellucida]
MVDDDLGTATIVYETPEDGTVERVVQNEHVAYFQDHWILKTDEDADRDVVRRIPRERVHYVERSVEEFEQEVGTLRNQVESFADDVRKKLLGSDDQSEREAHHIDVESDEDAS